MIEKKKYERPILKPIVGSMPSKAGVSASVSVQSTIDDVDLTSLTRKYGSPLFVFSEKQLRSTIRCAKNAFQTRYPSVVFAWSYKTNYLNKICQLFHQEGSWAEVVSGFEYQKALQNGCAPAHILFNGPSKTDEDLELALRNGSLIHLDNRQELLRLAQLATQLKQTAHVAIRVNLDAGIYPHWDRFGFNLENGEAWKTVEAVMANHQLNLEGLHCHIGTFVLSVDAYRMATEKMAQLAVQIEKHYSHAIRYIDMGGGFASKNTLKGTYVNGEDITPSFDNYAEAITSVLLKTDFPSGKRPMLLLETGRALVDEAGSLLTTVLTHKRLSDGSSNTVIDAGVNLLFTSYWYNHKISVVDNTSSYVEETKLTGPLCMNIDVIREKIILPLLNRGDKLLIHNVGAYNVTQWMQFIQYRPAVVMITKEGQTVLLRQKESMKDIIGLEQ